MNRYRSMTTLGQTANDFKITQSQNNIFNPLPEFNRKLQHPAEFQGGRGSTNNMTTRNVL
jgi:hypothetical protein